MVEYPTVAQVLRGFIGLQKALELAEPIIAEEVRDD